MYALRGGQAEIVADADDDLGDGPPFDEFQHGVVRCVARPHGVTASAMVDRLICAPSRA